METDHVGQKEGKTLLGRYFSMTDIGSIGNQLEGIKRYTERKRNGWHEQIHTECLIQVREQEAGVFEYPKHREKDQHRNSQDAALQPFPFGCFFNGESGQPADKGFRKQKDQKPESPEQIEKQRKKKQHDVSA